jgi:hypothetical protein
VIGKHPQADRILVAKISVEAKHHAKWRELTACWPPFLLSVKSASGVIAGEGHLRRCGTGRATTP